MTITTTNLTRAAGLSAVAAGLLFIGVQVNHPHIDTTFVTTNEWAVREGVKVVMAVLSLAGITGMYLRQVKQIGALGLLGYLLSSVGYLLMLGVQVVAVGVLPSLAHSEPGYVSDVIAVATGGHAIGDVGLMQPLSVLAGIGYLGGGLLFGVALWRADILARWAAVLLAFGTVATGAIPLLPQINERLFAVPPSVAMIGLGLSLWRLQRTPVTAPRPTAAAAQLDPAGAR
jgi:hypothetical protein